MALAAAEAPRSAGDGGLTLVTGRSSFLVDGNGQLADWPMSDTASASN